MKTIYHLLIITLLWALPSNSLLAQDTPEEDNCWCKNTETPGDYIIAIYNIDSLVAHDTINPAWKNLVGCDDEETDCNEQTCTYERKICRMIDGVKVCNFEPQNGVCTNEEFGAPAWDTTGVEPGDCECIFSEVRGNNIQYIINVSKASAANPSVYEIVESCEGDDCEKNVCKFKKTNPRTGEATELTGFCSAYWPKDESSEAGEPQPKSQIVQPIPSAEISFYPNPSSSHIFIQSEDDVQTTILDMSGKVVLTSTENQIDVSLLSSGTYIIHLKSETTFKQDRLIIQ